MDYQAYHPEVSGFENALKCFRTHSEAAVQFQSLIALPFNVKTQIESINNLAWLDNSCKIVLVRLKAFLDDYAVQMNAQDFVALRLFCGSLPGS